MMKKLLCLLMCIVLLGNASAMAQDADIQRDVEDYVSAHQQTTAAMMVSVFDVSSVRYTGYFGCENAAGTPVSADTVMDWGSISKLLVWVSVMQLWEQGQVELDADIRAYLPEGFLRLTYDEPVTLLHCMNHTAGFEESFFGMVSADPSSLLPLGEYLAASQPRQAYRPGTVCAYSNWTTALAGYVVERVSGQPYADYVRQHIFMPLGIGHAALRMDLSDDAQARARRLQLDCYTASGDPIIPTLTYIAPYPAGSCVSTLGDLVTFAQALLDENSPLFASPDTRRELLSPSATFGDTDMVRSRHGLWHFDCFGQTPLVGHAGNTGTCSSQLLLDVAGGTGIVVMTNQANEQTYNFGLPALLYGANELPGAPYDGITQSARTITRGPLKLYSVLCYNYHSSAKTSYMNTMLLEQDGRRIIAEPYGDSFTRSVISCLPDGIMLLLLALALIYSVLNLLFCLFTLIRHKKHRRVLLPWRALCSVLPLAVAGLYWTAFSTMNASSMLPTSHYRLVFMVIAGVTALCALLFVYGCIRARCLHLKGFARFNAVSTLLCLAFTIANVIYWNMFMFWLV